MRISSVLRSTALILFSIASALVHAQFQPPTDEELKMTSDPKAPGAAAVYLYREETTDDALHYHSYYARIKVLTEKGKELATVSTPYERGQFKVTDIKGRTIHADGTVIPLTTKPEDLMDFKNQKFQVNSMVFTLPSVEVGSILEYRLQIRYDDSIVSSPQWEIQQPYFVHKAHYMFNPEMSAGRYISDNQGRTLDYLMYSSIGVPQSSIVRDQRGRYTVDVTDVPAIPRDDWMPPMNTLNWRLRFYYTYARTGVDFWQTETKRWAKDADRFANPGSALKQAVGEIVAPGDTDDQKARKIYAAVMKLDNTRFSRAKSEAERKAEQLKQIKDAEDVWKQKSGSANEIALTYIALARAAGLKAWPIQVVNRDEAMFDPRYLNMSQLDDYLAIVEVGGKEVILDPGEKMCPFGGLHWKHTLASGVRETDKGPMVGSIPPGTYKDAVVTRFADLEIGTDGSVKGIARIVMNGPEALHWRQLALENDSEEVKKRFNESLRGELPDGVEAEFDHFLALEQPEQNLIGIVKISGSMGTTTGKRAFLPGVFFESHASHPFVAQEKRTTPIDVHYARMDQEDVTYKLPEGFTVESSPKTADLSWPQRALLRINSAAKDNTVQVTRMLARNFAIVDPKDYGELHDFYQKVATADQQPLVLVRPATAAKGN